MYLFVDDNNKCIEFEKLVCFELGHNELCPYDILRKYYIRFYIVKICDIA